MGKPSEVKVIGISKINGKLILYNVLTISKNINKSEYLNSNESWEFCGMCP